LNPDTITIGFAESAADALARESFFALSLFVLQAATTAAAAKPIVKRRIGFFLSGAWSVG